jgi:hypothetical protein
MQRRIGCERIEGWIIVALLLAGCTPAVSRPVKPIRPPTATILDAQRKDAGQMAEHCMVREEGVT